MPGLSAAADDDPTQATTPPAAATRRSVVAGTIGAAVAGCVGGTTTTSPDSEGTASAQDPGPSTDTATADWTGDRTPDAVGEVLFAADFQDDPADDWSGAGWMWTPDGGAAGDGSITISQAAVADPDAEAYVRSPEFSLQPQAYYEVEFDAETNTEGLVAMYRRLPLNGKVGSDAYTSVLPNRPLGDPQSYVVRGRVDHSQTEVRLSPRDAPIELDHLSVTRVGRRRVAAWSDQVIDRAAPVEYDPPEERFEPLPTTRSTIADRGSLTVLLVGDSIVNDVANGHPDVLLERANPGLDVELITAVRGSTGLGWFARGDRYREHVLEHGPDLVVAGGVSTEHASEYRLLIERLTAASDTEVLAITGGLSSPSWRWGHDDPALREGVASIADELGVGFFDSRAAFEAYLDRTGIDRSALSRDGIHGNSRGKAVMARQLTRFLTPDA